MRDVIQSANFLSDMLQFITEMYFILIHKTVYFWRVTFLRSDYHIIAILTYVLLCVRSISEIFQDTA